MPHRRASRTRPRSGSGVGPGTKHGGGHDWTDTELPEHVRAPGAHEGHDCLLVLGCLGRQRAESTRQGPQRQHGGGQVRPSGGRPAALKALVVSRRRAGCRAGSAPRLRAARIASSESDCAPLRRLEHAHELTGHWGLGHLGCRCDGGAGATDDREVCVDRSSMSGVGGWGLRLARATGVTRTTVTAALGELGELVELVASMADQRVRRPCAVQPLVTSPARVVWGGSRVRLERSFAREQSGGDQGGCTWSDYADHPAPTTAHPGAGVGITSCQDLQAGEESPHPSQRLGRNQGVSLVRGAGGQGECGTSRNG